VVDFAALDANGDQQATTTELADYVRQRGFTPIVVEGTQSSEQDLRLAMLFRNASAQRDSAANDPLQAFRRYDLNDDESWELDEFLAFEGPPRRFERGFNRQRRRSVGSASRVVATVLARA
jgi:hypothetical protein